jgi:hypothetical protein
MSKLIVTLECLACILRQVVEASEYASEDASLRYLALRQVVRYLNKASLDQLDHVKIGSEVHRIVKKVTRNPNPYRELKQLSNRTALEWLSRLGALENNLPFMSAVRVAAAGNIIDYGAIKTNKKPEALFAKAMKGKIDSKKVEEVKRIVKESRRVLYLCDNAGEIAFDKLLVSAIQNLGSEVTVAVRGGPIMNDATLEDASQVGMDKLAKTITTGTDVCGILLTDSSREFLNAFHQADLIISKGQGNLESLVNVRQKPVTIYILKVKCNLIANHFKSKIGSTEIIIQRTDAKVMTMRS